MKKTYKVVGPHMVDGHKPGSVFIADLGGREWQLVEFGHLAIYETTAPSPVEKEPAKAAATPKDKPRG